MLNTSGGHIYIYRERETLLCNSRFHFLSFNKGDYIIKPVKKQKTHTKKTRESVPKIYSIFLGKNKYISNQFYDDIFHHSNVALYESPTISCLYCLYVLG